MMSPLNFCTWKETKEGGLNNLNELNALFCDILHVQFVHSYMYSYVTVPFKYK